MLKKLASCLAPIVFFSLFPVLLSGQAAGGGQMSASGGKSESAHEKTSVTGCLQQGSDTGGYYIKGEDGKVYELSGKGLGEHVGHTVTVTGRQVKMSKATEEKMEKAEKEEGGGTQSGGDLKVSSVKMVSTSCK